MSLDDFRHGFTPKLLTEYEESRAPHLPTMDPEVKVSVVLKTLESAIVCPICLSILTNTLTTKECLHRFCADCITKSLRYGKKECPTCRTPCASRRSLRPDPTFDDVIAKLYPNKAVYDQQQDAILEKIREHSNQKAVAQSIEEGLKRQAASRPLRRAPKGATKSRSHAQGGLSSKELREYPPIAAAPSLVHAFYRLTLTPSGGVSLNHRFLNVPEGFQAVHLRKFLARDLASSTLHKSAELSSKVSIRLASTKREIDEEAVLTDLCDGESHLLELDIGMRDDAQTTRIVPSTSTAPPARSHPHQYEKQQQQQQQQPQKCSTGTPEAAPVDAPTDSHNHEHGHNHEHERDCNGENNARSDSDKSEPSHRDRQHSLPSSGTESVK